jgi:serine/threonine-protein kinase
VNDPRPADDWERVTALFDAAVALPVGARAAFVAGACSGDVRRRVERLVAAHERAEGFLEVPPTLPRAEPEGAAPPRFGPYRVVRLLGRGGMGTVYLAERADREYTREVAIKLLRHGPAGDTLLVHFRRERQILASLDHPNIARLLDGGTTDDGAPYFVMEHIRGEPIDDYCDARSLSVEERVRLFRDVVGAVSYAHQRLVVHRDIKPSNILVGADGVAKLLDFGIAKILDPDDPGPAATATGLRMMTREYASPEQVRGEPVTTATDVYALGLLLYELLVGERPLVPRGGGPSAIERAVLEEEAPRPSTRAPAERRRELRGDLDAVVAKALEKDPRRRYPSAEALLSDLERHHAGLTLSARPTGLASRAWKFVRRHRFGVASAGVAASLLAVGVVGTAWQAQRASREARRAEAARDFLKSLFAASSPEAARGRVPTVRQLLDDGAARIEAELSGQPDVQSEMARLVGDVYIQLGEYERALTLLQAELARRRKDDPSSVMVAEVLTLLGDAEYQQSRFDEALRWYEEALAIQRARAGARSTAVAGALRDIANVKRNQGSLDEAERLTRESLALFVALTGTDSRDAYAVRGALALTFADADRYEEALVLERQIASWRDAKDGTDHPRSLSSRHNEAFYLLSLGRAGEAARVAENVVAGRRRVFGPRHDFVGKSLQVLARAQAASGRADEALRSIDEAVDIHRETLGPDHLQVALDRSWRATIAVDAGRPESAAADARAAVELFEARPGAPPVYLATVRTNAGLVLLRTGALDEADRHLERALAYLRTSGRRLALGRALEAQAEVARRRRALEIP